jgi:hypothetical protein
MHEYRQPIKRWNTYHSFEKFVDLHARTDDKQALADLVPACKNSRSMNKTFAPLLQKRQLVPPVHYYRIGFAQSDTKGAVSRSFPRHSEWTR